MTDRRGATAIEYALLVGAIAATIIGAVFLLGAEVTAVYDGIHEKLGGARSCEQAHQNCGKGNN